MPSGDAGAHRRGTASGPRRARVMQMPREVLGSPRFADQAVLQLSWMAEARMTQDWTGDPTSVCSNCNHVRWLHSEASPFRTRKCACGCIGIHAFLVAVYTGDAAGGGTGG